MKVEFFTNNSITDGNIWKVKQNEVNIKVTGNLNVVTLISQP